MSDYAAVPYTLEPVKRDEAAYARRHRAGLPGAGRGQRGTVPTGFRNGLPEFRPYAYRGTGKDIYAGTYGSRWLDAPDAPEDCHG
jgi:hypothetical protein